MPFSGLSINSWASNWVDCIKYNINIVWLWAVDFISKKPQTTRCIFNCRFMYLYFFRFAYAWYSNFWLDSHFYVRNAYEKYID